MPTNSRMPRTKSSLLSFSMRQFISADCSPAAGSSSDNAMEAPKIHFDMPAASTPTHKPSRKTDMTVPKPEGDCVWVDAFFYGFWMPQSKVADYQQSLQQHGGAHLV